MAPFIICYTIDVWNELCEACQSGKAGHLMQLFIKSNLAGIDFLKAVEDLYVAHSVCLCEFEGSQNILNS